MGDWRAVVIARLRESGVDIEPDASIVDEIAQHLDDRYRSAIAGGSAEDAAYAAALAELDGSDRLAAEVAARRAPVPPLVAGPPRARPLAGIPHDLRYAARSLRRSPAFTATAVLTIALCTGPTIAALGAANWLLFRPPAGVTDPGRLGVVWFGRWRNDDRSFSPSEVSYEQLAAIQAGLTTVAGIAGHLSDSVNLSRDGMAPRVAGAQFVTTNYFDVVGVGLSAGRGFQADDDRDPGGAPVVVIGEALARGLFGTPDAALGQPIRINDHQLIVSGVVAPGFEGTIVGQPISLWFPGRALRRLNHSPRESWHEPAPFYEFLVRLRREATFEQADAELRSVARALADTGDPEAHKYAEEVQPRLFAGLGVQPMVRDMTKTFAARLVGAASVLVLLGLANLINLFVFRAARRGHEAGIRQSLGASAARLLQLHLAEGLLVSCSGVLLGVGFAAAAGKVVGAVPVSSLGPLTIAIDWRTLIAAAGLAIGVALLLSVASARLTMRRSLAAILARETRTGTGAGRRLRSALAVVQLALSLTLLVGGLLFVQTLRQLQAVELGIDVRGVSTFTFEAAGQGYSVERIQRFYRELVDRVSRQPGVEAAAAATGVPLTSSSGARILPPEVAALAGLSSRDLFARAHRVLSNEVTPDYFRVMGMRFIAGRPFAEADAYVNGPAPAVVISAALAQRLFGTVHAAGRQLSFPAQGSLPRYDAPIVGVVNDVRWRGPRGATEEMVYLPFANIGRQNWLMVRSSRPAADVSRMVQQAAAALDPDVPVSWDQTMVDVFNRRVANELIFAWVLGALSVIGFTLAAVGIYGLVSQSALERVREFGIRIAIGAGRAEIVRLVARQALVIAGIGVPLGVLLAWLGSRSISSQLFGVAPLAPGIHALAVLALIAAVIAAVVPAAIRAVRVDPIAAMRVE